MQQRAQQCRQLDRGHRHLLCVVVWRVGDAQAAPPFPVHAHSPLLLPPDLYNTCDPWRRRPYPCTHSLTHSPLLLPPPSRCDDPALSRTRAPIGSKGMLARVQKARAAAGRSLSSLDPNCFGSTGTLETYLNTPEVQTALHVPSSITFAVCSNNGTFGYSPDIADERTVIYPALLAAKVKVLIYNGEADLCVRCVVGVAWAFVLLHIAHPSPSHPLSFSLLRCRLPTTNGALCSGGGVGVCSLAHAPAVCACLHRVAICLAHPLPSRPPLRFSLLRWTRSMNISVVSPWTAWSVPGEKGPYVGGYIIQYVGGRGRQGGAIHCQGRITAPSQRPHPPPTPPTPPRRYANDFAYASVRGAGHM